MRIKLSRPLATYFCFALGMSLIACTQTDPVGNGKTGSKSPFGSFVVSLKAPEDNSQGYTSLLGSLLTGPSPSPVNWKEVEKSGSCRLVIPNIPFCNIPCGSGAACVEKDSCQNHPQPISVGALKVQGMKTNTGAHSFTMNPILNSYQMPIGMSLNYPPASESDTITISSDGDTAYGAFKVSVMGIQPLTIPQDSLMLEDGKALQLRWTAPTVSTGATVSVSLDISHHGGTKGAIECLAPDNGSLDIPASMVDKLKALGISGYPKVDLVRKRTGQTSDSKIKLEIESALTIRLSIPGLISCQDDTECPISQTCQKDLRCK